MRRNRRGYTSVRSTVALVAVTLVVGFLGGGGAAGADEPAPLAAGLTPNTSIEATSTEARAIAAKLSPKLQRTHGSTTVFVELDRPAAVDTFNAQRRAGASQRDAAQAASETKGVLRTLTDTVLGRLRVLDNSSTLLYRTSNAVPGFAVRADAATVRELAKRDDVRSVRTIVPKTRGNASADQLTRTLNTWQQTGKFGDGITIGIVDDGLDYTHADFGGPGTKAAYEAIERTKVDPSYFPTAKVIGGTDLSGDDYTGTEDGDPNPKPDPNPLACSSHGTHVAGTAAGFGVTADGKTFAGDYAKLTAAQLNAMKIGPGSAPKAKLYAVKVFGCEGSTDLTGQAMDRALDPNGDGNFSDQVDVLNMSLGGDFAAPDDPDSLFVRKLAANGVLPVISSGNAGDLYDAGGAPGNSVEALTVASVRDAGVLRDAVEVRAPSGVAGNQPGQYSEEFTGYDDLDITRPVVKLTDASNKDGCQPFSAADKAAVAGKIVWLEWDDNDATRKCGSAVRADNAETAGAEGVLLSSTLAQFSAGIAGNKNVPQFQLTGQATSALRPALDAGTLQVRFAGPLRTSLQTSAPNIVDTPSSFTSRGVRGPAVKPDVAAPGDSITSALSGSGTGRLVLSGTSMAAPHTAGIAALLRQVHPNWTPEEIKAGLMNTANAAVHAGENGTGRVEAPQRVGSGRLDTLSALSNQVLAMVQDDPGAVSVSFGTVEAAGPLARTKTVKLVNKGSKAVTFNAAYKPITKLPGVSYRLSAGSLSVPAGGTATVRVTLRVDDAAALRKQIDPSMEKVQAGLARQFLADASGNLVFAPATGSGASPLRVPVYAAPKPVADINTPAELDFPAGQDQVNLALSGRGVDQGTGAQRYASMISALQLQATSPELPQCTDAVTQGCAANGTARAGDLRYVGATSTAPLTTDPGQALLGIGVATWGDWYNIGSNTSPFVQFDVDDDGKADFETSVTKLPETDVLVTTTFDLKAEGQPVVDIQPVNGQLGDVDTNVFDTNVIVLPVRLAALGIDPKADAAPLSYVVGVSGYYPAPGDDTSTIDAVGGPISYDPLNPGLWVSGAGGPALTFAAKPGSALAVHRNAEAAAQQDTLGLLTLNFHNARGDRASALAVDGASPAAQAGVPAGDRELNGSVPLGDRELNGSVPLGDRELNGSVPLGDRELNSSRPAGDRELNGSAPLGDRELNGSVPLGDRELNSSPLGDREL